MNRKYLKELKS